jgi:septum formation protein
MGVTKAPIVLASRSAARGALLRGAGIRFTAEPADIDEESLKAALKSDGAAPESVALALAEMKARRISTRQSHAFVIGADQLLACDALWLDKATDRADAARQLRALSGRAHELPTAITVFRAGARLWHHVEAPRLTMRSLDEAMIARYLDSAGAEALGCVGAYRLEGLGAQLFARIEGDYFAILGLPLLPLLGFLRGHGLVP